MPSLDLWGWVQVVLSVVGIVGLLVFMFVPAARNVVLTVGFTMSDEKMGGFIAGVLVTLGLMILMHDSISVPIVRQQNIGWIFLVLGVYFALGRSLLPVLLSMKPYQVTFLVLGLVLAFAGSFILWRKRS